jgi:hypothetical protein
MACYGDSFTFYIYIVDICAELEYSSDSLKSICIAPFEDLPVLLDAFPGVF